MRFLEATKNACVSYEANQSDQKIGYSGSIE